MSVRRHRAPPTTDSSWVAWLLAAGVTGLLFLSIGLPPGHVHHVAVPRDTVQPSKQTRSEQLVFQEMPRPPVSAAAPAPVPPRATQPAAQPATPRSPVGSARTPAAVPPRNVKAPAGVQRVAPDSAGRARSAQPPRSSIPPSLIPPPTSASPTITSSPPRGAGAAPTCTAPCLARARAGFYVPQRTLTPAERDSVLRALMSSIPAAARESDGASSTGSSIAPPRPGGLPPVDLPGGTSIPVGLPGGGPSRAQRKRDSTVNAHVLPILERLRLRADSVRAARRRDSLEAIAKQQRDSSTSNAKRQSDSTSTTTPDRSGRR